MPAYADQIRRLHELGPRTSGSETHRTLIEDVAGELAGLGYTVERDTHSFERWDVAPDGISLRIGEENVGLSSAWPYSGETGEAGVTAPLVLVEGVRKNWSKAAGKIAVLDVHNLDVPSKLLLEPWSGGLPFQTLTNPVIGSEFAGTDLSAARAAGVVGVVATWRGLPDDAASGQYLPFTRGYQGLPAVWVGASSRDRVRAAARRGDTATLVLAASRTPNASMDTLWAVSPGTGALAHESVLVVTHSDGGNAVEENGHLALVELAREAAAAPHERTIVFVYTAGHLRIPAVTDHGQATTAWLTDHPDLWSGALGGLTAVAGLAIEHLGAKRWRVDPGTGHYGPDGTLEPELLYATTRELADLTRGTWSGAVVGSATPVKPGALVHLGEGEPLYEQGIPAVALVTGPDYLLAERTGDLVDVEVLARQVDSFGRLLKHLAGPVDKSSFGTVQLPGKLRKALAGLRVLLYVATHR